MDRWFTRSPLLVGLVTIWLFVLIGSLITAFLLNYTNVKEDTFNVFSYSINIVALLVGGWMAGRRSGQRGWVHGGMTGLLYVLMALLVGMLAFDTGLNVMNLVHLLGAGLIAALGGMIGVNMQSE